MQKKIAVLPGDGIGPEVVKQALKVLRAIGKSYGHEFEFESGLVGGVAINATNDPFPEETEKLCVNSDAVLFGAIGDPKYDNNPHAKVRPEQGLLAMRKKLGLFANIRPVKSYPALNKISPLKESVIENADFTVFRELTGGIYFGEPRGRDEEKAWDTCVYSRNEIKRIAKLAFEAAGKRRKKLTLVDKANVLETSRLWREVVQEMGKEYPSIQLDFMFIDNAAMKIIQKPAYFDVVLTENMFGDILTDAASVITGSLGMLPSASIGEQVGLFEPIHGSYPEVAGLGKANPIGAILSAGMLLQYSFGLIKENQAIIDAVDKALHENFVTEDIDANHNYSTDEVGDKIATLIWDIKNMTATSGAEK